MHTKLPWSRDAGSDLNCDGRGPNGEKVFLCYGLREIKSREHQKAYSKEASANADLIVRAVNNHDSLVSALELALLDLRFAKRGFSEKSFFLGSIKACEEALAKAKS